MKYRDEMLRRTNSSILAARVREGMLGPNYFYHRWLIERSKGWSPDEIRQYQEHRYGRLLRRYGTEITSKEDYRDYLDRYTRWDIPLLTHTVRTGGTIGQPLQFKADTFARRQKERAYLFDIWSRVGYEPYDLRVSYRDLSDTRSLLKFDPLENQCHISIGITTGKQASRVRRYLQMLPPFFLYVHPSSLRTFIDLVGEDHFRRLPVRGVLAGSEGFPDLERVRFERAFGIRVAHWYGHSEYAALAYLCRECGGFHFYPTYGYVELFPSETESCQRIIASSFNRIGTQFVRYDTGDLAASSAGHCTADSFLRVGAIAGRSQETFVDDAGKRRAVFGLIFGDEKSTVWDQVKDLQVTQDRPGALIMRVVPTPLANKAQIEQFFRRRVPMARIEFDYVRVIEREPGAKRRYFIGNA